ncbi:phage tail protein [Flavobacterium macacae]|uniref:PKD domain-containing protein n=1 Tax=Flavobacterium macacae TaxID=2488993 RepID=A0A3P3W788_9FLAO|nr:hypothetical protein [Flavobacterium macacae]RRJ90167.1 hypothetical protein EG849_10940 [Flavobacterium macacae]
MKNIKLIASIFFVSLLLACSQDDSDTGFFDNADAPANISALFTITQNNSGLVTIAPHGEGIVSYEVFYGDATVESVTLAVGQKTTHTYAEGQYNVKIIATGINGKTTEAILPLTVAFVAPENVAVTIIPATGDTFTIGVTATADFETYFEVWYGEDPSQTPVQFNEGQTVNHTYAAIGTYAVRVVAYSGGVATTEVIQNVTISNPVTLPITFENATLNYQFSDFGNAATSKVANPDISGINLSANVGKSIKTAGAEVWAGTTIVLDSPIDFSTLTKFRVKVWSPAVGVTVKMKIENLNNGDINHEVDQVTTVANAWQYLTYDFGTVNTANSYSKVIFFFNFGTNGSGDTYYFDDIRQTDGAEPKTLPLTFESTTLNYGFGDFGNAFATRIANPQSNGMNTSAFVAQVVKNAGAEVWAGTAITLTEPIDFSSFQKIKIKVWSPAAGIPVLLKLENSSNTGINTELSATTTVANAWQELTYDLTGINNNNNYQNVVLFFDFGTNGTGATYYFDDVKLSN